MLFVVCFIWGGLCREFCFSLAKVTTRVSKVLARVGFWATRAGTRPGTDGYLLPVRFSNRNPHFEGDGLEEWRDNRVTTGEAKASRITRDSQVRTDKKLLVELFNGLFRWIRPRRPSDEISKQTSFAKLCHAYVASAGPFLSLTSLYVVQGQLIPSSLSNMPCD